MKIVFVCGSLEPGRDGVGDYARRLAAELIRQGHQVAALALHDTYVEAELSGTQQAEQVQLSVLRIPASYKETARFAAAQQWVDAINPDWLSLQYVAFAFQPKGLPWGLGESLARLGRGRRWHIMFHELWVGVFIDAPLKHIVWGWVQKQLIKSMVKTLRPAVMHTQTRLYQLLLGRLGFKADYLPLFANIPVTSTQKKPAQLGADGSDNTVSVIIFGTIHPGTAIAQFAQEASQIAKTKGTQFSLTTIGRCGANLEPFVKTWQDEGLTVNILGEQPAEKISEVLRNGTIGLSTTSLVVTEKSGTVAAMVEHGLPVLCIARAWWPRGVPSLEQPVGIAEYHPGTLDTYLSNIETPQFTSTVPEIARVMAQALATATK
ncbi:glycosyltransferase [Hymenobacter sp. YC55]|uniref:glycosyltransferase n=1 Tax=Hymenobacter sp. YC55 TaxID=3034019 RepID=UPI0023F84DE7|nr:glycosyltransferase [Hymenobacter sp. YC55]MDF7810038.1 glycosyltransferase [Hymenobacter sp. YC55]